MSKNEAFLSTAECRELTKVMERKYAGHLGDRFFEAEASRDENGVYVKVTLRNDQDRFVYPVEGRMAHDSHQMSHREAALFLMDFVDAYFEEYFAENGEVYLPIDWADYECDSIPLQLKGQILNLHVERMADELLASGKAEH